MTGKRGRRGREKRRAREGRAVTRPVPLDNCDTTIRLNRWLKKHGFRNTSRLRPADFPGTGRGLMACKSISSGQVLVSLPRELMITTQTVLDSYLGPHVSSWHPRLAPVDVLSVFLVCERCRGDRSPWQPYVDSLPERFTTPAYFTRRELRELPRSLDDAVWRQRTAIAASYNDMKKFMDELEKSFPEFRGTMTQDAHCWAWHIVNTRSVYMEMPASPYLSPTQKDEYGLAPYLDLLNHSETAQVEAGFNALSGCYEIRTLTPYRRHEQPLICYGAHDNRTLLLEYGFTLPRNPHGVVLFTLEDLVASLDDGIHSDAVLLRRKLQLLRDFNMSYDLICNEEGPSWRLMTALRVLLLPSQQMGCWQDVLMRDQLPGEDEATLHDTILHLIQLHLAQYSSSIQADEVMLDADPSYHSKMALQLRLEDKRTLLRCKNALLRPPS